MAAINGALQSRVSQIEAVIATVAVQQSRGDGVPDLDRVSTIERCVVQEATTAVDSCTFLNSGELHGVVAQVAGHDGVAD